MECKTGCGRDAVVLVNGIAVCRPCADKAHELTVVAIMRDVGAKFVCDIHDELVYEVPRERVDEALDRLRSATPSMGLPDEGDNGC